MATSVPITTNAVTVTDNGSTVAVSVTSSPVTVDVGTTGPQGASGVGVPAGGGAGAVLVKASGTDYDTEFTTTPSGITLAASQVTGTAVVEGSLPYSAVVPAFVQVNATSGTLVQEYFAACAYNARAYCTPSASADLYMEWTVFVAAGTYTLRTIYRAQTVGGIASISIDGGSALGTTIDMYAAANASNNITDITGIALTAGRHTIRFTGAQKNPSSTGYQLMLHGFSLTRTGA